MTSRGIAYRVTHNMAAGDKSSLEVLCYGKNEWVDVSEMSEEELSWNITEDFASERTSHPGRHDLN